MDNEYFASINEVSKRLSVPAHTLRYWEKQFPVAIRPTTGAGGRRYYRAETVDRLIVIKELLYTRGMTIAGVKKMLRDGDLPRSIDDMTFCAIARASQDAPLADQAAQPNAAAVPHSHAAEIDQALALLTGALGVLQ